MEIFIVVWVRTFADISWSRFERRDPLVRQNACEELMLDQQASSVANVPRFLENQDERMVGSGTCTVATYNDQLLVEEEEEEPTENIIGTKRVIGVLSSCDKEDNWVTSLSVISNKHHRTTMRDQSTQFNYKPADLKHSLLLHPNVLLQIRRWGRDKPCKNSNFTRTSPT